MKPSAIPVALVLFALLITLGTSSLGLGTPAAFATGLTPEILAFGPADSPLEVFIVSDWFCPACRAAEPEILKAAAHAEKQAKVVFIDYPIHRETLNYIPYNLAFMVKEKGKYLRIREALAALARKAKAPTAGEVQTAVSPLGVQYEPLEFSDVLAGTQYQMSVVQKYKVSATPTVVVTNTKTEKVKLLVGTGEITSVNILRAMEDVSDK